jgi:hypothetical protein
MEDIHNTSPEEKYALLFGQIAVAKGYITQEQLMEALLEQFDSDSSARLRPRKLIGEILFEKGWLSLHQIDLVLKEILIDSH